MFRIILNLSIFINIVSLSHLTSDAREWQGEKGMWERAKGYERTFRFSTLFTAQDVHRYLNTENQTRKAIEWCKTHGITRVFIEVFRDGFTADKDRLVQARDLFRQAGLDVAGCVTPTGMGKASNGWKVVSNYEASETQTECRRIFKYAASLFDVIMVDDFLFTDDTSEQSIQAKGEQSWSEYRSDLMLRVSREHILTPARNENPQVEVIIKYPQWYDRFHERGYNVETQTDLFDWIWVGTETRDPDNERWGRKAQYEAFYIMRWLTDIGGEKTGGGWFDTYGTSPATYVEQARQTILGGAKEALLFHYGDLLEGGGAANIERLMKEMPSLFMLSEAVAESKPAGILAPKIPNSKPGREPYIYDFIGMLGIPLVPLSRINTDYSSAFFATQSWQSDFFPTLFDEFIEENKPVVITNNLKSLLDNHSIHIPDSVMVFDVPEEPRDLYQLDQSQLQAFRTKLLRPLGFTIEGPAKAALYLFDNGVLAIENFRDEAIQFKVIFHNELNETERQHAQNTFFSIPNDHAVQLAITENSIVFDMPPRSLGVIKMAENRFP